jgi:hypothetical protein
VNFYIPFILNARYFYCRQGYERPRQSWPAADLDHKVRASGVTFFNSETLIQMCMIFVMVSESGLQ